MENVKAGDIVWVVAKNHSTPNSLEILLYRRKLTSEVADRPRFWYNCNMNGVGQTFVSQDKMYPTKEAALKHIMEE